MTKPCPTCGMMPAAEWRTPVYVAAKDAELRALREERDTLKEALEDKRLLAAELDKIINGDAAAPHPALCDVVAQIARSWPALRAQLREAEAVVDLIEDECCDPEVERIIDGGGAFTMRRDCGECAPCLVRAYRAKYPKE